MDDLLRFIGEHGYAALFAWVWLEQAGLPVPGEPILVAVGALAAAGQLRLALAFGIAAAASLLADLAWYAIGRQLGSPVLRLLCRIALEPDSCVRRTASLIGRVGGIGLVVGKFVPGLNTLAQPTAGALAMPLGRFLVFDTIGIVVWLGTFIGLGYAFSDEVISVLVYAQGLGIGLLVALVSVLAVYLAWKMVRRRRCGGHTALGLGVAPTASTAPPDRCA